MSNNDRTLSFAKAETHKIFIDEDIGPIVNYRGVIDTLSCASPDDTVEIHISSFGGMVYTTDTITHAMDKCPAKIHGVLSGTVASAATVIALHCDSWEVATHVSWMAHSGSFGLGGETYTVRSQHDHQQEIMESWLYTEYEGFYTEDEIFAIAEGKDSWLTADELITRLSDLRDFRVTKAKQRQEDEAIAESVKNKNTFTELLYSLELSPDTMEEVEAALSGDSEIRSKAKKKTTKKKVSK